MTDVLDQLGATVAGVVDNPAFQLAVQLALAYLVVLWLAAAFWVFRDMRLRARSMPARYVAAMGVLVATPLFFLLAITVYRIVRPGETIQAADERLLSDEALAASVRAAACPSCGAAVGEDWNLCPWCRFRLQRPCPRCGQPASVDWDVCPWCVEELPPWVPSGSPKVPFAQSPALPSINASATKGANDAGRFQPQA
jgi:RNA polymerase subunit RPABC4/transcription elongation factor Spt4